MAAPNFILSAASDTANQTALQTYATASFTIPNEPNQAVYAWAYIPTSQTLDSATCGGVAMTKIADEVVADESGSRYRRLACFYLLAPPSGAGKTVEVTRSGAGDIRFSIVALLYDSVHQAAPDDTAAQNNNTDLSSYSGLAGITTTEVDSLVLAGIASQTTSGTAVITPEAGQTTRAELILSSATGGNNLSVSEESAATAGAVAHGWGFGTSQRYGAVVAIAIRGATAVTLGDLTLTPDEFPTNTPEGTRLAAIGGTNGGAVTLTGDASGAVALGTGGDAGWLVAGATVTTAAGALTGLELTETLADAIGSPKASTPALSAVEYTGTDFYADPDATDDSGDGLSVATAVKSWDAAVALINASGNPNDRLLVPRATPRKRLRAAAPAVADFDLDDITASGLPGNPIKFHAYGTGLSPHLSGDKPVTDWSSSASDPILVDHADPSSIEKHTYAEVLGWSSAPCHGGRQLFPAQYPHCSAINNYHNTDEDSDAFFHLSAAECDLTGYNAATEMSFDPATGIIYIRSAARLARYANVDLTGYKLYARRKSSQTLVLAITDHDQVNHEIQATIGTNPDNAPFTSVTRQSFFWGIRYHPLDIVQPGQYGWEGDPSGGTATQHAHFPPGDRERTVMVLNSGLRARSDDVEFDGIGFSRFAVDGGTNSGGAIASYDSTAAHRWAVLNADFEALCTNGGSFIACFGFYGSSNNSDWLIEDITISGCFTAEGFRNNAIEFSEYSRITIRETGGTAFYVAGGSNNNNITDIDSSDTRGQHANALTVSYQLAFYNNVVGWLGMNVTNGLTTQVTGGTLADKASHITSFFTSIRIVGDDLPLEFSKPVRIDGGWTNGLLAGGFAVIGDSAEGVAFENTPTNTDMVFQSLVLGDFSVNVHDSDTSLSMVDVTLSDVLLLQEGTNGDPNDFESVYGANALVRSGLSASPAAWDGTITDEMWQTVTRALDGSGAYESRQLGPSTLGWTLPAYGSSFTRGDLKLTTTNFMRYIAPKQVMASVTNMMPGESYSIDETHGVGSDWELIRGQFRAKAGITDARAGEVKLDSECDHANCTNTGARSTIITLTREDYSVEEAAGAAAPANTVLPVVTGTLNVGRTLTLSTGTWTDAESYAFQWLADDVEIVGATSADYLQGELDEGAFITGTVTATGPGGSTAATSEAVGPVGPAIVATAQRRHSMSLMLGLTL